MSLTCSTLCSFQDQESLNVRLKCHECQKSLVLPREKTREIIKSTVLWIRTFCLQKCSCHSRPSSRHNWFATIIPVLKQSTESVCCKDDLSCHLRYLSFSWVTLCNMLILEWRPRNVGHTAPKCSAVCSAFSPACAHSASCQRLVETFALGISKSTPLTLIFSHLRSGCLKVTFFPWSNCACRFQFAQAGTSSWRHSNFHTSPRDVDWN